jgi:hypothetical protein
MTTFLQTLHKLISDESGKVYFLGRHAMYCGHGRHYDEQCSACDAIWEAEELKALRWTAHKLGYKLVPLGEGAYDG